ncbi:MAG: pyruvate kinase alpha/beta domain-containing protein [Spirochaetota bacterium]
MESSIVYFKENGKENTAETLSIAKKRSEELKIKTLLVASIHGYTALKAAEIFKNTGMNLVAVSISPAFEYMGWKMTPEEKSGLEKAGITVLTSLHGLADGVSEGLYGDNTVGNVVANTLRMFSQGMKVAVEISIMALEAGMIEPGREVISLGGTNEGADTAIVARPAFAHKIKEFIICEVLCKPRLG